MNTHSTGFHGSSVVKNLPAVQKTRETQVRSLGQKDSMEKKMATYFSILAWKAARTGEPGGLQTTESQRIRHNWACVCTHTHTHTHTCTHNIWENPLKDAWILSLERQSKLRGLLQNSWPLKSWNARENWENVADWKRRQRQDNLRQHVSLKQVFLP